MTKLTPTQRGLLLRRARQGATTRELAAEFNISQSTVSKLVRENTPPDPKAIEAARLQVIIDDESLPVSVRLMAADELKKSLNTQAAPGQQQAATPRPLHVASPHASSLDGVENLFGDEPPKPKPVPPPKPAAPTPAEQRAKDIERANAMMSDAVASGNVAAINRLTEIFRKQGLYAPEPSAPVTAPAQVTPPVAPPDEGWLWLHTYRLEMAAIDGDRRRVDELRAEFVSRGLEVPAHKGYTPPSKEVSEPERAAVPLLIIDEAGMALQAIRVKPVGPRHMDWETYRDSF